MSIVNFNIPKPLEKRVAEVMREKGFSSKAEFFRFAAIFFIDIVNKPALTQEERFNYLTHLLKTEVSKTYRGKKIPPLKDQLAGL